LLPKAFSENPKRVSKAFRKAFQQTFHRRHQRDVGRTFYVTLIVTLIVRQAQAPAASRRRTQPERHLQYTRLRIPLILISHSSRS
jgi:hypothetical protein